MEIRRQLWQKSELCVCSRKIGKVWEHRRKRGRILRKAIPAGKLCRILLDRCRRQPTAAWRRARIHVVRPAQSKGWEVVAGAIRPQAAIKVAADDRAAQYEHMIAPGVIRSDTRTRAGRIERPVKIGHREGRDAILHSLSAQLVPERTQGLADGGQEAALARDLVRMRVKTAHLNIKDLPRHIQRRAVLDDAGNLPQLTAETRIREGNRRVACRVKSCIGGHREIAKKAATRRWQKT